MVQQQFCNSGITLTRQNHLFCSPLETVTLYVFQMILGQLPHVPTMYHLPYVDIQPLLSIRLTGQG